MTTEPIKRVLVTGATGFIGRQSLAPLLARGFEVHAVTSHPLVRPSGNWHQADLLQAPQVAALLETVRPTHLLHFAWYAKHGEFWTSAENLRWVQASLDLLRQFQRHGGERVVMAGTCAEYDWGHGTCVEATTPIVPISLYGTAKQALSLILASFAATTGLSAAWGRIFLVYGPFEHPDRLVAAVCRALLKGEPALCSHGEQVRDLLFATDAADAFAALLDSPVSGTVNVASGQPMALDVVVRAIADLLGRPDLLRFGALATAPDDPPRLVADTARLNQELGWYPQTGLTQGLQETIAWWRKGLGQ